MSYHTSEDRLIANDELVMNVERSCWTI